MADRRLAVTLLALAIAGCGTVHAGADSANGGGAAASPALAGWVTYGPAGPQIVSVGVGGSGRVLAVAVQVPAGHDGCMRDLTAGLTEFDRTAAYLSIGYQSRLASVFGACPADRVMTVRVRLPAPLGQRDLMINSDTTFAPSQGALMRRCNDFGCGPFIEPPASCGTRSYQQAMLSTGPPMHAAYQVLGCERGWLVLDVGWPGGPAGCDAPCNPHMAVTRWFFRDGPDGWITIASALAGGCAQVRKAEPLFPARLCARLPAPG